MLRKMHGVIKTETPGVYKYVGQQTKQKLFRLTAGRVLIFGYILVDLKAIFAK